MIKFIKWVLSVLLCRKRRLVLSTHFNHVTSTGALMTQLDTGFKLTYTVTAHDQRGSVFAITNVPLWTISDSSIATIQPSVDGLTAVVTAVHAGDVTVTVTDSGVTVTDQLTVRDVFVPVLTSLSLTASTQELV